MIIKNGCVVLRAFEERDTELLLFLMNDPDIEYGTVGYSYPVSLSQQKLFMSNWRNSENGIKLMIELTNGKTIGMVSFDEFDWKNKTVSIGYKIYAQAEDRIKGDMVDALKGMLKYAFNELNMNCVHGTILEDNKLSLKLAKKVGFKEEGILRNRAYKNGSYKNLVSVSVLKDEFEY